MTAFDKAWGVVKNDEDEWDWFNPHNDTCTGCGGQMTPHWPGYGPDGPENGNCDNELRECDTEVIRDALTEDGHWGQMGLPHDWDPEAIIRWIHDERRGGRPNFPEEGMEEVMREQRGVDSQR